MTGADPSVRIPRPAPGPGRRRSRTIDGVVRLPVSRWPAGPVGRADGRIGLGVVVVLVVIGVVSASQPTGPVALAGAAVTLGASTVLFLRRPPLPLLVALVAGAGTAMTATGGPANLGWFTLCVVGGWCALRGGTVDGVVFVVASALTFAGEMAWTRVDQGWLAWTAGVALTVGAALAVRRQIELTEQLRALQQDLLEASRVEERNRIARDLHDVIAHSLTVALLHVSGARLALEDEPQRAAAALADAERLTRQSLADVRATVGRVRDDGRGTGGTGAPAPTLADVEDLVAGFGGAGSDVALEVDPVLVGRPEDTSVPATTSTNAYRIVQEALTNAARHAPDAPVEVHVHADGQDLDVRVDSAGPPGQGQGLGLVSMRERAEAVGGSCTAGPAGGGWSVHARLPLPGPGEG